MIFISVLIVVAVIFLLVKVFILSDIGLTPVSIESDGFYFKDKDKAIKYKQIEKIDLRFTRSSSNEQNERTRNYTNLEIKFKDKRRDLLLHETTHKDSFWPIIQACRNFNNTNEELINFGMVVPSTEEELIYLIKGWGKQYYDVLEAIENVYVKEYALENGVSFEAAENKIKLLKVGVTIGFMFFVFVLTIILIILNGVTLHIV